MYIKNNKGPNIDPSELPALRIDHLKPHFVGDFSKNLLKDIAVCFLCCFVVTYIKLLIFPRILLPINHYQKK